MEETHISQLGCRYGNVRAARSLPGFVTMGVVAPYVMNIETTQTGHNG